MSFIVTLYEKVALQMCEFPFLPLMGSLSNSVLLYMFISVCFSF